MKIKKITKTPFEGFVYNFSVEDFHNYVIFGIVCSNCHYCYTSATKDGTNFDSIVDKADKVWGVLSPETRPFQIAIGGAGESTLHPDWVPFVRKVRELGIVPNYTTNGMHLTSKILSATEKYCGGVALSWHPHIEKVFHQAVQQFSSIKTRLNFHVIVGDTKSLQDLKELYKLYNSVVDYFVILPYQAAGRGQPIVDVESVWKECFNWVATQQSSKFAFGALFYNFLKSHSIPLEMAVYEPEIFSGYRIMDDTYDLLRKSSYDLRPKHNEQTVNLCISSRPYDRSDNKQFV